MQQRIFGSDKAAVANERGQIGRRGSAEVYCEARESEQLGRYPANLILDEEAASLLDKQSGTSQSRAGKPRSSKKPGEGWGMTHTGQEYSDRGGASRFFYCAKASRKERGEGNDLTFPTFCGRS
jgi:site-specific DNA-methyltransferase (adenine-specific)